MLRRLITPRWLGALLAAALFAVAAYYLGGWQYGRHEAKVERNARLDAHYRAEPVPVLSVVSQQPLQPEDDWTRVEARGRYDGEQFLVRNRPNESAAGFEVVAPLTLDSGESLLVDRGWVARTGAATALPSVAPPPTGEVTVIGWVRPGEAARGKDAVSGQLTNLSLSEAGTAFGTTFLGAYLLMQSETLPDGSRPDRPQALAPPDRDLGPHQAYAYQWWFAMPIGFVLIYFGIRRELRIEDPQRYPSKPKKQRIWDEEDG